MDSKEFARNIRINSIKMAYYSKISHIGSALSICDILAVLFNEILNVNPLCPTDPLRDRFILSKGHASMALYSTLSELGFFPMEELFTQGQNGSRLSGHVSHKVPGIEFSTGSLGMGLSVAAGIALSAKRDNLKFKTYVILGDGECQEGSIWEAAMFASHNTLSNLIVIIDHNKIQANERCENICSWSNISNMWHSFGWHVRETNGHNFSELRDALSFHHGVKPVCIIAHTVKGKGVSFMENEKIWHHLSPNKAEFEKSMKELQGDRDEKNFI